MSDTGELLVRHKLTVADIYWVLDANVLHEDDRVELVDGELLDMAPIGEDHAATVNALTKALVLACGDRAIVRVQSPVRLDDLNEPQPDFAILRLRPDRYRKGRPGPADVLLLVEVADSSMRFDRRVKLPSHARFGIPEMWITDLQRRVLETHRTPVDGVYADTAQHKPGERVSLALLPEAVLVLAGVFDQAGAGACDRRPPKLRHDPARQRPAHLRQRSNPEFRQPVHPVDRLPRPQIQRVLRDHARVSRPGAHGGVQSP